MDSQAIALVIAAGGLVLGLARFVISVLSYRLDAKRTKPSSFDEQSSHQEPSTGADMDAINQSG